MLFGLKKKGAFDACSNMEFEDFLLMEQARNRRTNTV